MDPNANLVEQRRLQERIAEYASRNAFSTDDLNRLVELTQAMDEWLSKGGFLPDAWKH
jgi:hypothetical protein